MKKGITSEQVLDATLNLIDQKEEASKLNFRDIARELGCAHTNLYNFFPSYEALLWEAQEVLLSRLQKGIEEHISQETQPEEKLKAFFCGFIDAYMEHRGWFSLAWYEKLSTARPKKHYDAVVNVVDGLLENLAVISDQLYGKRIEKQKLRFYLHNIHCYMHGELSIFFAGKGLIADKNAFRAYVVEQSVKMMKLLLLYEDTVV